MIGRAGTGRGQPVDVELRNRHGLSVRLTNHGARLLSMWVPDRDGHLGDVVLGFDDIEGYEAHPEVYFGATIGRVANRIANGRFTLDGTTYELARNDPPNHLHGGSARSFDKVIWEPETAPSSGGGPVTFRLVSPDLEEGYPGTLTVSVSYELTDGNELRVEYEALTDKPTPVNLTNHSYWDLSGAGNEGVLGHELWVNASYWTPVARGLIPTGEVAPTDGTALDFRAPHLIGDRLAGLVATPARGYDHNLVLDRSGAEPSLVARLSHPGSGRVLELLTTEPALQVYSGNLLAGLVGKRRCQYDAHAGLCLEPQRFPDAVNHDAFPSVIVHPGRPYRQTSIYRFSTEA
ncbi:MAG: aldose epimerase family protein [Candidatus Limnocylindrales bacterium]